MITGRKLNFTSTRMESINPTIRPEVNLLESGEFNPK
jgi:hypothetical protein